MALNRIDRYAGAAAIGWSLLCGLTLLFLIRATQKEIYADAKAAAQISIAKDVAYRHWVAARGGVYVPVSEATPPNPHLQVPEREITTPSGRLLTLVNPAYMTRQVLGQDDTPLQGHITSLNPLNPDNKADPWETRALQALVTGATEFGEPRVQSDQPFYRYMQPLWTEKACLRCHGQQGYKEGDLRGGISVVVPLAERIEGWNEHNRRLAGVAGITWLAGLLGIHFSRRRISAGTVQLQRERDNLELLFEVSPNANLLFDRDCRIVLANAFFRRVFCSGGDPTGKRFGEIIGCSHAATDPRGCGFSETCSTCTIDTALLAAVTDRQQTLGQECCLPGTTESPEPSCFIFSVSSLELFGEVRALLALADISRQKRAEAEREGMNQQLLQMQKVESIGRLAGGVAHDFNNMLAAILANVELTRRKLDQPEVAGEHLEQIAKAAGRSADLTRQLLGFARKQAIEPKVLHTNRAIGDLLPMLRRLIGEDIELLWKPSFEPLKIWIDPAQLHQILTNLVVNARDAMPHGGKLILATSEHSFPPKDRQHPWSRPGNFCCLGVSDNGCGMSAEVQEKIFEPFFTTKEEGQGTGLGLATVFGIVQQNRGFLSIDSKLEKGTRINVFLPLSTGPIEASAEIGVDADKGGKETILLVEDEKLLLEATGQILQRVGYQVIQANSPRMALELFAGLSAPVDLLLTDVIMPGMNGAELAEKLRRQQAELRVVYMSGYPADIVNRRGILLEEDPLLQKPLRSRDLLYRLREIFDS